MRKVIENLVQTTSTVVQTVLITLKVTDYVDWSWIWVMSPMWGSLTIMGVVLFWLLNKTRK